MKRSQDNERKLQQIRNNSIILPYILQTYILFTLFLTELLSLTMHHFSDQSFTICVHIL